MKEFFRKKMVALKRKPQTIAFVVLIVSFLIYSLNLRNISDTTAQINTTGMGLTGFATMLFSMLSILTFLNSFPHRKNVNVPMLVLFFLMQGIIIFCDQYYLSKINWRIANEIAAGNDVVAWLAKNAYVYKAYKMLNTHTIFVGVTVGLVALLPVYSKLLKKINTSIEVEGNEDMGEIEIASEN